MSEENNQLEIGTPIDLFDESGESVRFDHLDTIEMDDKKYIVLTPRIPETEEITEETESDVYIMQLIEGEGEDNILEIVEDEAELEKVFNEFKKRMSDEFEFVE